MIPFASQRGEGQDLATHLLNEHDNEYVELHDLRGSMADDLHGAFSEWEVHAQTMTKCKNYLYSLSVNPDPKQGVLSREQYMDYLDRVETKLGLECQPRAVVFHIKDGREHAHAVYSRIDFYAEKAIHLAFDKDKLMMVTREFSRDHDLELPRGYQKGQYGKNKQLSLYDKAQEKQIGITKAQRMEVVTDLWRQSDSAKAFVSALEDNGYLLTRGRKPYVLVDYYGHKNALPRLIDDKQVRLKDVVAFLKNDFPSESLPTVEQAEELVKQFRKTHRQHTKTRKQSEQLEALKHYQRERRDRLAQTIEKTRQQQQAKVAATLIVKRHKRSELRQAYLQERRLIKQVRQQQQPKGLAGFLAKASGYELLQRQWHRREDRQHLMAYLNKRQLLQTKQQSECDQLERSHTLQMIDLQRKRQALSKVEQRECSSLQTTQRQSLRRRRRYGVEHMPALHLGLGPPGRRAMTHRATQRHLQTSNRSSDAIKGADNHIESANSLSHVFGAVTKVQPDTSRRQSPSPKAQQRSGGRGKQRR